MCDFYYNPASPPCRSVLMVAKNLGIDLNLKVINTHAQEHLTPEFVAINPQHTIPTLVDDGFAVWESRAILSYLAEKYGKDDSLYPKDPQKRAIVNQRLYFDMGTLYQRLTEYFVPIIRLKQPADPEKLKKVVEALELLDKFLADSKFVAGANITIADYSLIVSVSTLEVIGHDFSHLKNLSRWYALCNSTLPGIEVNITGIAMMKEFVKKLIEA